MGAPDVVCAHKSVLTSENKAKRGQICCPLEGWKAVHTMMTLTATFAESLLWAGNASESFPLHA